MKPSVVIAAAVLLGGQWTCTRPADLERERAALLDADVAFAQATAQDRLEGWVSFFATDGAMVRPGGLVTGPEAIREHMRAAFSDSSFALTWEPTRADVGAAGDLGYTLGRYESRRRGVTGRARVSYGTYLTVWRKQGDGAWKVVLDIGSPDG